MKNIYSQKDTFKEWKGKSQNHRRHLPTKKGHNINIYKIPMNESNIIKHSMKTGKRP